MNTGCVSIDDISSLLDDEHVYLLEYFQDMVSKLAERWGQCTDRVYYGLWCILAAGVIPEQALTLLEAGGNAATIKMKVGEINIKLQDLGSGNDLTGDNAPIQDEQYLCRERGYWSLLTLELDAHGEMSLGDEEFVHPYKNILNCYKLPNA